MTLCGNGNGPSILQIIGALIFPGSSTIDNRHASM